MVERVADNCVQVTTLGAGILVPRLKLALDSATPNYATLISHAHADHIPWDATHAYASPETCDLLALRRPELATTPLPWREPTRIGDARVTLYPAGHVLGSALTLIEAASGETLLYTGDTKPRAGFTCPRAEYPRADALVVESTFALPIFRFPPLEEIAARAVAFARSTLDEGVTPVFTGYALGKSQEIAAILLRGGIGVVAHGAVWNVAQVYERNGLHFDRMRPYAAGRLDGAALIVPGSFRDHPMITKRVHRLAYSSGWAMLSKSRIQHDADILLPISDHADHPGLLEIVNAVGAKRVFCNHGYSDVFAHLLRKRGFQASSLSVGHLAEDVDTRHVGLAAEDAR